MIRNSNLLSNEIQRVDGRGESLEKFKRLLNQNLDLIDLRDEEGKVPLYYAATAPESFKLHLCYLLVSNGADPDILFEECGWLPLHCSALKGDAQEVARLIGENQQHESHHKNNTTDLINATIKLGRTSLHLAAGLGHVAVCEYLLLNGADVTIVDVYGQTALHAAVENGSSIDICEMMVEKGHANINALDKYLWTPLHFACGRGYLEICRMLLAKGADVKMKNDYQLTPLHMAASEGYREISELLIGNGADVRVHTQYGKTPLHFAAKWGHNEICEMLVAAGADVLAVDANNKQPLHSSAEKGHLAICSLLISHGADVTAADLEVRTSLHWACENGHDDCVLLLLEKGAVVQAKDKEELTPLHYAARRGHLEICRQLIANGADVLTMDKWDLISPLHLAAEHGHTEICSLFIDANVANHGNVNVQDMHQMTPLHMAAWYGHYETCKVLVTRGTLLDNKNSRGATAMHIAAGEGFANICQLLLDNGAEVESRDNNDNTPLHRAADEGHRDVVVLLLHKGADYAVKDKSGKSPLHLAQKDKHKEVCNMIIESMIERESKYQTPLYYAAKDRNIEMIKILIEEGYDVKAKKRNGDSLLHAAASKGNADLCMYYIYGGASLATRNKTNKLPLELLTNKDVKKKIFIDNDFSYIYLSADCYSLWFHILQVDDVPGTDSKVELYLTEYPDLALVADADGRVAMDLAGAKNKIVIHNMLLWHGKYSLSDRGMFPEYFSDTVLVFTAHDESKIDVHGKALPVALKLFRYQSDYLREIEVRRNVSRGLSMPPAFVSSPSSLVDHGDGEAAAAAAAVGIDAASATLLDGGQRSTEAHTHDAAHTAHHHGGGGHQTNNHNHHNHHEEKQEDHVIAGVAAAAAAATATGTTGAGVSKQQHDNGSSGNNKKHQHHGKDIDDADNINEEEKSLLSSSEDHGSGGGFNANLVVPILANFPSYESVVLKVFATTHSGVPDSTVLKVKQSTLATVDHDSLDDNMLVSSSAAGMSLTAADAATSAATATASATTENESSALDSLIDESSWTHVNKHSTSMSNTGSHDKHYIASEDGDKEVMAGGDMGHDNKGTGDTGEHNNGTGGGKKPTKQSKKHVPMHIVLDEFGVIDYVEDNDEGAGDVLPHTSTDLNIKNDRGGGREHTHDTTLTAGTHTTLQLPQFEGPDVEIDVTTETGRLSKPHAERFFCIVMPLADATLKSSMQQEWSFWRHSVSEVKCMFIQVLRAVEHMHARGYIHGDIHPGNIARFGSDWKLIDLDSCCAIGRDPVCRKYVSAYIPPEATAGGYAGQEPPVCVHVRCPKKHNKNEGGEGDESTFAPPLLVAHPSFDVWSLACVLYPLLTSDGRSLFNSSLDGQLSDSTDDIGDNSLRALHSWTDELKAKKLSRVTDPIARDLLSGMLRKDPSQRLPMSEVVSHSYFMSSYEVVRGELTSRSPRTPHHTTSLSQRNSSSSGGCCV